MAISQKASDYLAKRIQVDNEIVTFRLLSRELRIHVNEAKNELARFHLLSKSSTPVHATYFLSGEVLDPTQPPTTPPAGPDNNDASASTSRMLQLRTKVLLISEDDVEQAKSQFSRIICTHVYSLSPGAIKDSALLAGSVANIRKLDAKHGPALSTKLGMVIAPSAQVTVPKPSAKQLSNTSLKSNPSPPSLQEANRDQEKRTNTTVQKSKPIKTAEKVGPPAKNKKLATKPKPEPKVEIKTESSPPAKVKKEVKEEVKPKLLAKRSARDSSRDASSDAESIDFDRPPKKSTATMHNKNRLQKGRVLSDEEEEEEPISPPKKSALKKRKSEALWDEVEEEEEEDGRGTSRKLARLVRGQAAAEQQRNRKSEKEDSLRAMMELDDDPEVSSAARTSEEPKEEEESEPEHVPLTKKSKAVPAKEKPTGVDVVTKSKKRKSTAPLGSNGKKKRKVTKTREKVNAKGYTVTEDYSSYESVSGSESEDTSKSKPSAKPQKKAIKKVVVKEEEEEEEEETTTTKPKPKIDNAKDIKSKVGPPTKRPSMTKAAGSKGLMSYFGKK